MLGVATLIVVMSVMNGFRHELLDKIVGINGHVFLQAHRHAADRLSTRSTQRVAKVPGVKLVIPMIEGAAGVSSPYNQAGALVRGIREADLKRLPGIAGHVTLGTLDGFDTARRRRDRPAARRIAGAADRRHDLVLTAKGAADAVRRRAAHQELSGRGDLPDRHVGVRLELRLHAAGRSAGLLRQGRRGDRHRGLRRRSRPHGRDARPSSTRRSAGR